MLEFKLNHNICVLLSSAVWVSICLNKTITHLTEIIITVIIINNINVNINANKVSILMKIQLIN